MAVNSTAPFSKSSSLTFQSALVHALLPADPSATAVIVNVHTHAHAPGHARVLHLLTVGTAMSALLEGVGEEAMGEVVMEGEDRLAGTLIGLTHAHARGRLSVEAIGCYLGEGHPVMSVEELGTEEGGVPGQEAIQFGPAAHVQGPSHAQGQGRGRIPLILGIVVRVGVGRGLIVGGGEVSVISGIVDPGLPHKV